MSGPRKAVFDGMTASLAIASSDTDWQFSDAIPVANGVVWRDGRQQQKLEKWHV